MVAEREPNRSYHALKEGGKTPLAPVVRDSTAVILPPASDEHLSKAITAVEKKHRTASEHLTVRETGLLMQYLKINSGYLRANMLQPPPQTLIDTVEKYTEGNQEKISLPSECPDRHSALLIMKERRIALEKVLRMLQSPKHESLTSDAVQTSVIEYIALIKSNNKSAFGVLVGDTREKGVLYDQAKQNEKINQNKKE